MRKKIADTAQTLFLKEGYFAVSIRRIASEVGISPMTIYKYYDSKIHILRQLWALIFKDVFAKIARISEEENDPILRLNSIAQSYVGYWLNHPDHYRMVFMSEGVSQPEVSIFVEDEQMAEGLGLIARALFAALQAQQKEQKIKLKTDLLLCNLIGISHAFITISDYPWSSHEDVVNIAVQGILNS
ncbi:MAG: TetR/AcrR family transcriptional regulator [Sneathiella sp.]|nr:TetR/AcrR family transcriptional regulator [Sneathiella sp.]